MAGQYYGCSWCGPYNQCSCSSNSSSMFYCQPHHHHHQYYDNNYDDSDYYISSSSSSSSSSPSVDCTLSLGPPSTTPTPSDKPTPRRNSVSSACWDLLGLPTSHKNSSRSQRSNSNSNSSDPLLARRCANCDTTSTPLWRNGPRGPKSLCNACGIRYKKEERRSAAAAAAAAAAQNSGGMMQPGYYDGSWAHTTYGHHQTNAQKMQYYGGASNDQYQRTIIHDDSEGSSIQFLSWLTHA